MALGTPVFRSKSDATMSITALRLALTGGIACGKSTAAACFAKKSWLVISTDTLAHEALNAPAAIDALRTRHGNRILNPGGTIDRATLASIIFNNTTEKTWLENLIHPAVNHAWQTQLAENPSRNQLVEIPLLFEKKLETHFDFSVCVHCAQPTQLARMAARGLDTQQANARIQNQLPLEEKMRRANFCLFNEGHPRSLEQQITILHARLTHATGQ